MSSLSRCARVFAVVTACAIATFVSPARLLAQSPEVKQQGSAPFTLGSIADQLGTKIAADRDRDLPVGGSMTGTLVDVSRITRFGINGMHEGARVSVFRSAPGKLIVEVDEMVPTPVTKKTTVRVDEKGNLSQ